MNILVLNLGSSSIKYQLLDMQQEVLLTKGLIEKIGFDKSITSFVDGEGAKTKIIKSIPNHLEGIKVMIDILLDDKYGVIKNVAEIDAVGHRITQGGNYFKLSSLVDDDVKEKIKDCFQLAPLHNPHQFKGVLAIEEVIPGVPNIVCFDTVFHKTLPDYAYMYALPYNWYQENGVRKYGFHGLSHEFVSKRAGQILNKKLDNLKIISCHLGNGASVTAINKGKSVDTSMGFTPLQGLIMGTRCGDIDPTIISYIMEKRNYSIEDVVNTLNKESGVKGISSISSDFRDLEKAAFNGNKRAILALQMFYYRVKFYISAYFGILNGADAIVFTGGLGENSPEMREAVCKNLSALGIENDLKKNKVCGKEKIISASESKVAIIVIPTDEELAIAREVRDIISK